MPTVMITGANRGLGLEFTRQYAADGWSVISTCRNPLGVGELATIEGDIAVYGLDVTDPISIERFAGDLDDRPIDLLINNAGVYGPYGNIANDVRAEDWMPVIETNVFAPLFVARRLIDNVAASEQKKLVTISSIMGSIARGAGGSDYIYRSTKAALNMVMACFAQEVQGRGVIVSMLHPGWVQTDMGGAHAALTPAQSIAGMRDVIRDLGPSDTGAFKNYDGAPMPW